jgi:AraC family transcriptional regulator of adaptative response / methylphosphotriester-DNA alkyltransferase methyltransferase
MPLTEKILLRKDEITREFLQLVDVHISELMSGKAERRFHATDFGKRMFIHPGHLTNTLKLTTGKSPCDFMEERIMAEAKKLLLETDLSIADIGNKFGYEETSNFIKFFKSMAKSTPLQYRKKNDSLKLVFNN